jgi:glycine/D-amino acid oxidase-like deaminating enzyme
MQSSNRVVVVGAGVFGCAAAYYLAKRGAAVTVIERDDFSAHASSNNPGNLNPIHGAPTALLPLSLTSFELHRELADNLADLGCPSYERQPVSRVLVAFDEQDSLHLHEAEQAFVGMEGFSCSRLEGNAVRHLDPRISHKVRTALLISGNMSINSALFHQALADGAAGLGARFVRDEVTALERDNNVITAARTRDRLFPCDQLVLATGPWISQAEKWLGVVQEVKPVKGEMLRIALPGAPLTYDFTRGMISLYRRGLNECWIGVTKDQVGFDETPSTGGRRHLLQAAMEIMPCVADAQVLDHRAALRPMTPDGLPLAGRVPGWRNCYLANGGGIKGMLLCSGIGTAIADLIFDGETPIPMPMPISHQ